MLAFAIELQKRLVNDQIYLVANEVFREHYERSTSSDSKLLFKGLSGNPKETMQGMPYNFITNSQFDNDQIQELKRH